MTENRIRIRVCYSKLGKVRFTSHRDVVRAFERAVRRSGMQVGWSEGFTPRQLLSFGLALPTCAESLGEYMDMQLNETNVEKFSDPTYLLELSWKLSALLPAGVEIEAMAQIPNGLPSLQQEVSLCSWELEVLGLAGYDMVRRIEAMLDAKAVVISRERKGRRITDDIRPAILELTLAPEAVLTTPAQSRTQKEPTSTLRAVVATQPRGLRPAELVNGLGEGLALARACRMNQWIESGDTRREPLERGTMRPGTGALHAGLRAS